MKIRELQTPALLLDMDVLERNIEKYQELCDLFEKELWPMVEPHRSLTIAGMQALCTFSARMSASSSRV